MEEKQAKEELKSCTNCRSFHTYEVLKQGAADGKAIKQVEHCRRWKVILESLEPCRDWKDRLGIQDIADNNRRSK